MSSGNKHLQLNADYLVNLKVLERHLLFVCLIIHNYIHVICIIFVLYIHIFIQMMLLLLPAHITSTKSNTMLCVTLDLNALKRFALKLVKLNCCRNIYYLIYT